MTDEKAKKYEEDCKNSGNLNYPLAGCILSQLCSICKNYDLKRGTWDRPMCKILGEIPIEIDRCRKYECEYFDHDKDSKSNLFFDENLQPIYK